jgi:hypothetical protein
LAGLCASLLSVSAQAQVWTRIGPAVTPTPRAGAVVVYDPVHKQMVLFGGHAVDDDNETWILDEDVWTKRAPSHSPEARADAYGFWDSPRNRVLVFGGNAAGQIDRSRIWTWNGDDWSSFVPAKNPPARRDAAVAYDSTRDRIVLFGGVVDGSPDVTLADTWEFDGKDWSQVTTQASPIDRGAALMGYDPLRKITVLVGGQSESLRGLRYDTWTYDGSSWKEITNANVPRGTSLEMIWDPSQQKLLIAGRKETGSLSAWTFDGTTWSEQAKSSYNLNGIDQASLAFDSERGYTLYLRRENQTFYGFRLRAGVWDRPLPVPQPGAGVPGRGALTFDSAAGEPQLFVEASAGQGLQSWRWDGVMWRLIGLSGAQVPNATSRIAYDGTREITVAFDARTYELEGATWQTKPTTAGPATNGALAHDAGHKRLLYFGGSMGFAKYTDASWTWDGSRCGSTTARAGSGPSRRPSAVPAASSATTRPKVVCSCTMSRAIPGRAHRRAAVSSLKTRSTIRTTARATRVLKADRTTRATAPAPIAEAIPAVHWRVHRRRTAVGSCWLRSRSYYVAGDVRDAEECAGLRRYFLSRARARRLPWCAASRQAARASSARPASRCTSPSRRLSSGKCLRTYSSAFTLTNAFAASCWARWSCVKPASARG